MKKVEAAQRLLKAVQSAMADLNGCKTHNAGLCALFYYSGEKKKMRKLLLSLFRSWPKFSGNIHYPVPYSNWFLDASDAFRLKNRWAAEYGYLRAELFVYCLQRLQVISGNAAYYGLED